MASVLPDRDIQRLLGTVIIGGSPERIHVNSYEVRLGNEAKFDSTGETLPIPEGHYLEIEPGDFVTIVSLETLDFRLATTAACGKPYGIFAWITPTTTMMREGFLFASTKVDLGYRGQLNWGIRNSSVRTVRLRQGEPLFKLTIMELSEGEKPDKAYGDDARDSYQNTVGIKESARLIPAVIAENQIVRRSQQKLDPIRQLTQAGYPFNHIATELITLQGNFEVVSKDVAALVHKIDEQTGTLSASIFGIGDKIDQGIHSAFSEQFHLYFQTHMLRWIGYFGAAALTALAGYKQLMQSVPQQNQSLLLIGLGVLLFILTFAVTKSSRKPKN